MIFLKILLYIILLHSEVNQFAAHQLFGECYCLPCLVNGHKFTTKDRGT